MDFKSVDDRAAQPRQVEVCDSIDALAPDEWNALHGADNPFVRHEYLAALEHTDCVGANTGWQPCHLVLRGADGGIDGAVPLYLKTESWGEYVFDFAWAQAYAQAGMAYYPKLVGAIPYTPVPGARLLVAPGADAGETAALLLQASRQLADQSEASSVHFLFPRDEQLPALKGAGFELRKDCQFHWHNADYATFDDFLGRMKSRKAKKIRRERRRVAEAGIRFEWFDGDRVADAPWDDLYRFYASTFFARGRPPYFPPALFAELCNTMPEQLVVILARRDDLPVAAAICFRTDERFYGRYWGADGDYHSLHFETCYYQGIDYCIANGLRAFEPGTQGEHKLVRGFDPTVTWAAHWIAHPGFRKAIGNWLADERRSVDDYVNAAREHLPWRTSE
ncbi:MAG: GNAT family N-acetyltransferase [Pseudomonadota bacterium]